MTNARDKANIPVLNFQSKGIDDNADATAITINSSENVLINTTSASGFDAGGLPLLVGNGSTHQGLTIYTGTSHTGAIHFADGTGAGSYRGQINYRHDTDALQIAVAGSERMRLNSTGLGIGTSSPAENLQVMDTASNIPQIRIETSDGGNKRLDLYVESSVGTISSAQSAQQLAFKTAGGEAVRIDATGQVGIGTTAPSSILHAETTTGAELILSRNDTSIAVDDLIGGIQFKANDASSSPDPQICGIKAISTGATNTNPKLNFFAGESNYSANTPNMVIDSSGHVGISTSSPGTYNLNIQDSSASATTLLRGGSGQGVYQEFDVNGGTTIGYIGDAANLVSGGSQTDLAIRATNNIEFSIGLTEKAKVSSSGLNVNGALSKSSGSFKIDHPLENKKDTHHLVHSFVEAPQADNIYRGKVNLVSGTATVNIDTVAGMSEGTFVLLNREIQCFTSNETGWTAVKGSVSGNTLTITAQDNTCDDTISWMVIGERQDQHMYDTEWTDENGKVIVEPLKETETTTP